MYYIYVNLIIIFNVLENLSWTYRWIIKCILFLCIGFVIITIPFYLSGASFNLGFGPLLKLKIGHEKKKEKGNSLQNIENREPVQIILKVIFSSLYFNLIFLFLIFVPIFLHIYLKTNNMTNKSELFLGNSWYRRKSNNRHSSDHAIERPTNFKKRRSNCD